MQAKRIISFSLYGTNALYCNGAIRNAELAPLFYPGWTCRFHCDRAVPSATIDALRSRGCEVVIMTQLSAHDGMLWRWLPWNDSSVRYWVSRDADSRLNPREAAAVAEWIASRKPFHIMRDHPYHCRDIMGGMFGVDNVAFAEKYTVPDVAELIRQNLHRFSGKGRDQGILSELIWPQIKDDHIAHDSYGHRRTGNERPFPCEDTGGLTRFVGEVVHDT